MIGFNDFPKALNGWQSKLYALGYPGPYETGAMMRQLPKQTIHGNLVLVFGWNPGLWMAAYLWGRKFENASPATEAESDVEAVANLMIAHPELWRK